MDRGYQKRVWLGSGVNLAHPHLIKFMTYKMLNISQTRQLTLILLVLMDVLKFCQIVLELYILQKMLLPVKSLNVTFSPFSSLWPLPLDASHIEILFLLCPFGRRIPPPAHPLLCFNKDKNGHFCTQHHLQSDICLSALSFFQHLDKRMLLDMDICNKLQLFDQNLFNC